MNEIINNPSRLCIPAQAAQRAILFGHASQTLGGGRVAELQPEHRLDRGLPIERGEQAQSGLEQACLLKFSAFWIICVVK